MGLVGVTGHAKTMETVVQTSVPHAEFAQNVPPTAPTKSVGTMDAVGSVASVQTMKCARGESA